jgi:hypothetical protein
VVRDADASFVEVEFFLWNTDVGETDLAVCQELRRASGAQRYETSVYDIRCHDRPTEDFAKPTGGTHHDRPRVYAKGEERWRVPLAR